MTEEKRTLAQVAGKEAQAREVRTGGIYRGDSAWKKNGDR
jgi:hypothetical protein